MIRRPPRSTLFPYNDALPIADITRAVRPAWRMASARASEFMTVADRKSTRLNSSHTVISYAVFCLKKQNGTDQRRSGGGSDDPAPASRAPVVSSSRRPAAPRQVLLFFF